MTKVPEQVPDRPIEEILAEIAEVLERIVAAVSLESAT
jgi:hypothetical protein